MAGAAQVSRGCAVPALAAGDRGQRGAEQAQAGGASGGPGASRTRSSARRCRGSSDRTRRPQTPAAGRRRDARGGPPGDRLPLLPRPERGRDRRGTRHPPRNREVAAGAGAGTPARADGGRGMTPLEQMLRAAAAEAEWPPTPDLEAAVLPRIEADLEAAVVPPIEGVTARHTGDTDRPGHRLRFRFGRPLAIALAALLLLAGSALAIPAVRDWLGLSTVEVKHVPGPLPVVRGARLALGTHVPLDVARAKLGFTPLLPRGFGSPTVYYDPFPAGGQLGLVYPDRIVVTEVEGHLTRYIAKFIPPGTSVERL